MNFFGQEPPFPYFYSYRSHLYLLCKVLFAFQLHLEKEEVVVQVDQDLWEFLYEKQ